MPYFSTPCFFSKTSKRIVSMDNTDPWAKAGVMIRESLTSNSANAVTALTPGNGTAFQRRPASGGGHALRTSIVRSRSGSCP